MLSYYLFKISLFFGGFYAVLFWQPNAYRPSKFLIIIVIIIAYIVIIIIVTFMGIFLPTSLVKLWL